MNYASLRFAVSLVLLLVLVGCSGAQPQSVSFPVQTPPQDRTIAVTLLQLNDVYEIEPVEGGKRGGLARVAAVRKELLAQNPNTFTVIAGDFYSPSAMGTAKVNDERLAGKQMVAVLNAMGLDYATLGNHEFDVKRDQFYQRLEESDFTYVSGNVFDEQGQPFPGVLKEAIIKVPGLPGDTLRLGLIGVTLESNKADYVRYAPEGAVATLTAQAAALEDRTDALLALTHLALEDDIKLAQEVPALDLIMGGHEHENILVLRGPALRPIAKADANARTIYVHALRYDPASGDVSVESEIRHIDDGITGDPEVAAVVDKWVQLAFEGFRAQGLKPGEPVVTIPIPLDGRESSVRNRSTDLTDLIAEALLEAAPEAELSVYNSGSIRIDDVLPLGTVIQYDVIRVLPFGGEILTVDMQGSLLDSTLTQGVLNQGSGGFLQHANVSRDNDGTWRVQGQPIDAGRTYRVALSDFLVTGMETGLGYLTFDHPGLTRVDGHGDIRFAVIGELERRYGR